MANTSTRRVVSRPGVSAEGASGFVSPFQPPPAIPDLMADIANLDPNAWHVVIVRDTAWRVKVPSPTALGMVSEIGSLSGGARIQAISSYLQIHLHPDDLRQMLRRMLTPKDAFDANAWTELYRAAVTVGTARPFPPFSGLPERRLPIGALFEGNWRLAGHPHHSRL